MSFLMQLRSLFLPPKLLREGSVAVPVLLGWGGRSGTHLGDIGNVLPQGVQRGRHGPQPWLHLSLHPLAGDKGADDAGPAEDKVVTGLPDEATSAL